MCPVAARYETHLRDARPRVSFPRVRHARLGEGPAGLDGRNLVDHYTGSTGLVHSGQNTVRGNIEAPYIPFSITAAL